MNTTLRTLLYGSMAVMILSSSVALDAGTPAEAGVTCKTQKGRGPKGASLFFENCWWSVRICSLLPGHGDKTTRSYTCVSCPDLPGGSCPR
jgi:hypothetical protein